MLRIALLTTLAMLAFAGNSVLCRVALKGDHIDPLTFTVVRLFSGACVLFLLVHFSRAPSSPTPESRPLTHGSWLGAVYLWAYAISFSLAYVRMDVGPGALVLFAAVQLSMLIFGLLRGERLGLMGSAGLAISLSGLAFLLLPGSSAPPLGSGVLMALAGVSWGAYTMHGRRAASPLAATSGNFIRATPLALATALPFLATLKWDTPGLAYAVISGAVTSGLGYVVWYSVVRHLAVTRAGIVQLSVPVISVLAGMWWLQEPLTLRVVVSCLGVLGGMAIVLVAKTR